MANLQDPTGHSRRRPTSLRPPWISHELEMIELPAWRVLSLSARRVLDRLEIEHLHHGAAENGRLIVTYDQFARQCHMDRHQIAPALRELEALGFVETVERGAAGNAEERRANCFRLTYSDGTVPRSDEWEKIKTLAEAKVIAAAARETPPENSIRRGGKRVRKIQGPSGGFPPVSVGKTPTENQNFQ